jgi:hypothetical protein
LLDCDEKIELVKIKLKQTAQSATPKNDEFIEEEIAYDTDRKFIIRESDI